MVFGADDLAAWLIGLLADAGRKKLTELVFGTDQERALRSAVAAAVTQTAKELCPGNEEQARHLALAICEVFGEPAQPTTLAEHVTLLQALQAGIAGQLAALDDAGVTGTGQSYADVLGVPGGAISAALTRHLLREIASRGARGDPLFPLAAQLNHDVTHDGLRQLLEGQARLESARTAASPTALAQLPALVPGFTGRDKELEDLVECLDPGTKPTAVVVSAVAGLPGVGKSALAVHAAHAAQRRGWFGGGVLFIDLHGYDEVPVQPEQALDALLRALGVPADDIPAARERPSFYRSALAQFRAPVLVVADNASSETQVRPLLPGTGSHRVLITSRHTLAALGARLVDVAVLDEEPAIALLDQALRTARPGDDRITGDRQAAGRLASVCGGLPLALRIVAALLNADPALSAAELVSRLSDEKDRLHALRYDDGSDKAGLSVEAAFELSYRRLDDVSARFFRLLPVCPGPDVSVAAAAAVSGLPAGEARRLLGELGRAHLVETRPGGGSRWRLHDLLRLYARRLGDDHVIADRREQAVGRLLGYYVRTAEAAQRRRAEAGVVAPEALRGPHDPLTWLEAERASVIAGVSLAAATGRAQVAMYLPQVLSGYLIWRRRWDDLIAVTTTGLDAARRLGERASEGVLLGNLGVALRSVNRFEEAITASRKAVAIFREVGDRQREATALSNLGLALLHAGRSGEAAAVCRKGITLSRQNGHLYDEASALVNLGEALWQLDRHDEAINAQRDAVAIYQELGFRQGEAIALDNLAVNLQQLGRPDEAVTALSTAVAIYRDTGDRYPGLGA